MLSSSGCRGRRLRLLNQLGDGYMVIVADPSHLLYLAGYEALPFTFRSQESAALLIFDRERAVLVGDDMAGPYLQDSQVDKVVATCWYDGLKAAPHRRSLLVESALEVLRDWKFGRVGVEMAAVPAGVLEGLRTLAPGSTMTDVSRTIRALRRAKDADELEVLGRAMAAGEAAHAAILREARPGMTELEAYQIVRTAAERSLGQPAIVYGDFVSGPRIATEKGGPPTNRRIEKGDLLLVDFSVKVGGYRGDFTNTFAVGGQVTAEIRSLYKACLEALAAGEQVLRPGTLARQVDQAVRASFRANGLEPHFTTHTGHGLGLGHPESPYLVSGSDETLVEGDVIAIEPGLYIPGTAGMRIERNYLITAAGYRTLSNHKLQVEQ